MLRRYLALVLLVAVSLGLHQSLCVECTKIYFLSYDPSTHSGSVVEATLCVSKRSELNVSILGVSASPSVASSFIIATLALHTLCSIPINATTVYVYLPKTKISGPSGGLAYALGILEIYDLFKPGKNWSASGILSIDGFVDPVGALKEKIDAAKRFGIELVYVPAINPPTYNVSGVEIRRIHTLLDVVLCSNATNAKLEVDEELLSKVNEVFRRAAKDFLAKIERLRIEDEWILRARSLVEKLLAENHSYSAASLGYATYIRILEQNLSRAEERELKRIVDEASNVCSSAWSNLTKIRSLSMHAIPVLVTLLDRIKECEFFVDRFGEEWMRRAPKALLVELAVRAYGRSSTLTTWFEVLRVANESGGPYLAMRRVLDASLRVLEMVSKSIELNASYAPLSLLTIAQLRSSLASALGDREVVDKLRTLLHVLAKRSDSRTLLVPYLYAVYADDLAQVAPELWNVSRIEVETHFYSLATLVLGASLAIETLLEEHQSFATHAPNLKIVALSSISVALVAMLTTFYVVEERSSSRSTRSSFNTSIQRV